jgi:hypothetical protein
MRSTEREDDERYRSASLAHASHSRQLSSNSAFAASSVATRLSVRRPSGLLGKCNAQNYRRCSGPPRTS